MRPKNLEKEQAIRTAALKIISEEGLENLSMQKLAEAAGISPRTIYIKYRDKDDLLITLYIEVVLGDYEEAILKNFNPGMNVEEGIRTLWKNGFRYLKKNKPSFALMQYGKSSPLLNKAFQEKNIREGDFFSPIHEFLKRNTKKGLIRNLPFEAQRALLFAPFYDVMNEYFEHEDRPQQIITEKVLMKCCETVIRGILK